MYWHVLNALLLDVRVIQGVFVTLHFGALISFYPFEKNSNFAWMCYNSSSFGPANHNIWTCQCLATI